MIPRPPPGADDAGADDAGRRGESCAGSPGDVTRMAAFPGVCATTTVTGPEPLVCRSALVSDSWTIRYIASCRPVSVGSDVPETVSCTGIPASRYDCTSGWRSRL